MPVTIDYKTANIQVMLAPRNPLCPDDSGVLETDDGYDYVCKICGKVWCIWELGEAVEINVDDIGPEDAVIEEQEDDAPPVMDDFEPKPAD